MEFQLGPAWFFRPLLGPCPGLTSSLAFEVSGPPLSTEAGGRGRLRVRLRESSSLGLHREAPIEALSPEMETRFQPTCLGPWGLRAAPHPCSKSI